MIKDFIPKGVYYIKEHDNFYDFSNNKGLGQQFWNLWKSRAHQFPQGKP